MDRLDLRRAKLLPGVAKASENTEAEDGNSGGSDDSYGANKVVAAVTPADEIVVSRRVERGKTVREYSGEELERKSDV